jgi:outer membrane protein OmpA-like peptidoglycan-associated protein
VAGRVSDSVIGIYGNESVRITRPADGWSCGASEQVEITGFQSNSAEITPEMRPALVDLAERIQKHTCRLVIRGYASADGPPEWNQTLAKARAEAVAAVLNEGGRLDAERMQVLGEGGTTDFGRGSDNRRVSIQVGPPSP